MITHRNKQEIEIAIGALEYIDKLSVSITIKQMINRAKNVLEDKDMFYKIDKTGPVTLWDPRTSKNYTLFDLNTISIFSTHAKNENGKMSYIQWLTSEEAKQCFHESISQQQQMIQTQQKIDQEYLSRKTNSCNDCVKAGKCNSNVSCELKDNLAKNTFNNSFRQLDGEYKSIKQTLFKDVDFDKLIKQAQELNLKINSDYRTSKQEPSEQTKCNCGFCNPIGRTKVSVNIPENDPNPQKTAEKLIDKMINPEYLKIDKLTAILRNLRHNKLFDDGVDEDAFLKRFTNSLRNKPPGSVYFTIL